MGSGAYQATIRRICPASGSVREPVQCYPPDPCDRPPAITAPAADSNMAAGYSASNAR